MHRCSSLSFTRLTCFPPPSNPLTTPPRSLLCSKTFEIIIGHNSGILGIFFLRGDEHPLSRDTRRLPHPNFRFQFFFLFSSSHVSLSHTRVSFLAQISLATTRHAYICKGWKQGRAIKSEKRSREPWKKNRNVPMVSCWRTFSKRIFLFFFSFFHSMEKIFLLFHRSLRGFRYIYVYIFRVLSFFFFFF